MSANFPSGFVNLLSFLLTNLTRVLWGQMRSTSEKWLVFCTLVAVFSPGMTVQAYAEDFFSAILAVVRR